MTKTPIDATDLPGSVRDPTVTGLPNGFCYGVTRYADVILQQAFPQHLGDLVGALAELVIVRAQVEAGGGSKTTIATAFDQSLKDRGWTQRTIEIGKTIDGELIAKVRGHEIDMFKPSNDQDSYPGVAVEMEWNNKDPFFDRDLLNYLALNREGVLAVGVIVTRGPALQAWLRANVSTGNQKYGASTTHWDKLVPRVNLGGGGECPLLLIGIEPPRIVDP